MKKKLLYLLGALILIVSFLTPTIRLQANSTSSTSSSISNNSTSSDNKIIIENGVKYYSGLIYDENTNASLYLDETKKANFYLEDDNVSNNYYMEYYSQGEPYLTYENPVITDLMIDVFANYNLINQSLIYTHSNVDYNGFMYVDTQYDNQTTALFMTSTDFEKNIYFDNDLQSITFYLEHDFCYEGLLAFNNNFTNSFSMPLLVIDGVNYLSIRFNGNGNGFQLATKNCVLDLAYYEHGNVVDTLFKLTIPRVDYFKNFSITSINRYTIEDIEDDNLPYNSIFNDLNGFSEHQILFGFDEKMYGYIYSYAFDIESIDLLKGQVVLKKYADVYLNDGTYDLKKITNLDLNYIEFDVIYSRKDYEHSEPYKICNQIKDDYLGFTCSTNTNTINGQRISITQLTKTIRYEIDNTKSVNENDLFYKYFNEDFKLPNLISDFSFKVNFLEFNPYFDDVKNDVVIHQDYRDVNYYKYICSIDKTMNVFYYDMSVFGKQYQVDPTDENQDGFMYNFRFWDDLLDSLDILTYEYVQEFYFDFYFDNEKTLEIPNVKNISFKYQKGFDKSNPNDKNGFYNSMEEYEKYLKIMLAEKKGFEYNDKNLDNLIFNDIECSILYNVFFAQYVDYDFKNSIKHFNVDFNDNYGWFINGSQTEVYSVDETLNFYKSRTKNIGADNTTIYDYEYYLINRYKTEEKNIYRKWLSGLSMLEIYYETLSGETKKLVANSQGLHVVYDTQGIPHVYDSSGNLRTEYDVFTTDEGYVFPAQDINKDGIISSNETINSDTGEWDKPIEFDYIEDDSIFDDISDLFNDVGDWFDGVFDKVGNAFGMIGQVLTIVLGILALIVIINLLTSFIGLIKDLFSKKK